MADVDLAICLRSVDGKLIAIDANCEDVELPVCVNATDGQLWVYHAGCDGVGESDGWFQVCRAADGSLQITIPDNCCGCCGEIDFDYSIVFQYLASYNATLTYVGVVGGYCIWQSGDGCCIADKLSVQQDYSTWSFDGFVPTVLECYTTTINSVDFDCSEPNTINDTFSVGHYHGMWCEWEGSFNCLITLTIAPTP